jgi:hypothetical protein
MKGTPVSDHLLTHHVNVRNPKTGKVQTFEPGEQLPAWAHDALVAESHVAYPDVSDPDNDRTRLARAQVKTWQASKLAAEAAAEMER